MIKLENLQKYYGRTKNPLVVLKNINLQIAENGITALLGPSGSGKTTLLNIIGGIDTPSSGTVLINNKEIHKFSDHKLSRFRNQEVGLIFQEFHLNAKLTVKENILLPVFLNPEINNSHKEEKEEYCKMLIREVGLSEKTNKKVSELSGGQKQRTAIARALINNPTIILADEPTGNLDDETGEKIIQLLRDLQKKHGLTMLIATHDHKIAKIADRIIRLKHGEIC